MKRCCLVAMALLALPQVAPANLFDRPQHYEVLKLDKDGAKVVAHSRYVIFQTAEVAVPRGLFRAILERIRRLRLPEAVPR